MRRCISKKTEGGRGGEWQDIGEQRETGKGKQ